LRIVAARKDCLAMHCGIKRCRSSVAIKRGQSSVSSSFMTKRRRKYSHASKIAAKLFSKSMYQQCNSNNK